MGTAAALAALMASEAGAAGAGAGAGAGLLGTLGGAGAGGAGADLMAAAPSSGALGSGVGAGALPLFDVAGSGGATGTGGGLLSGLNMGDIKNALQIANLGKSVLGMDQQNPRITGQPAPVIGNRGGGMPVPTPEQLQSFVIQQRAGQPAGGGGGGKLDPATLALLARLLTGG